MAKSDKSTAKGTSTGVKCDAKNCVHHYGECECSASKISVGCQNACTCSQTQCHTFEMRKDAP